MSPTQEEGERHYISTYQVVIINSTTRSSQPSKCFLNIPFDYFSTFWCSMPVKYNNKYTLWHCIVLFTDLCVYNIQTTRIVVSKLEKRCSDPSVLIIFFTVNSIW